MFMCNVKCTSDGSTVCQVFPQNDADFHTSVRVVSSAAHEMPR